MKSYDETVDSVFDRIDKYNSEKIRRKKIITKAVVPACCFCLIALGGIGAWKSGLLIRDARCRTRSACYKL